MWLEPSTLQLLWRFFSLLGPCLDWRQKSIAFLPPWGWQIVYSPPKSCEIWTCSFFILLCEMKQKCKFKTENVKSWKGPVVAKDICIGFSGTLFQTHPLNFILKYIPSKIAIENVNCSVGCLLNKTIGLKVTGSMEVIQTSWGNNLQMSGRKWHLLKNAITHWFSTFLRLWSFNAVPHVVVTPNYKIILAVTS